MLRARMARLAWAWLLLGLVLAPSLGLAHRAMHGGGVAHAVVHAHVHASGGSELTAGPWQGVEHDCRLYDQHAHGDVASGPELLVLPPVATGVPVCLQGASVALRRLALFNARGPPGHG
jgi:hypothetical protein